MQNLRENWFQIWHEKFGKISNSHSKVWNFHFDVLFLSKVHKVWAKKIHRSYLSWHWTVMQNLNKADLVVSKRAWKIGWTFIRALKSLQNCLLIGSFFSKLFIDRLKNWHVAVKIDLRNLVNFHVSSQKSKNLHFNWLLLSIAYKDLDENVLKSYVSWQWRVMQNLKKHWLLVPKKTCRI